MDIAIIGAGIGGLAAALAVEQAGHTPTVYERTPADEAALQQGVFLTLAVNGQRALAALSPGGGVALAAAGSVPGFAPAAAATELGFATGGIRFVSGRGKQLGSLPIGPRLVDGTTARTVRRADLLGHLAGLVEARGIAVHRGRELAAVRESAQGVDLEFADGSVASAELVIGADGLHSRMRSLVHSEAPAPRYTGVLNAGGFARVPGLDWDGGDYWMTWGHRCFFGHTVAPDGEVWWFANPPEATEPPRGTLRARSTDEIRAMLAELLAPDAGPAAEIVAASPGPLQLWAQHDLPTIPNWTTGRTALLGDAAHAVSPTTGQGASLAIEDAVVLGRCLAGLRVPVSSVGSAATAVGGAGLAASPVSPAEPPVRALADALTAYEQARRPRTEKIAAWGRRTGNTKTAGPIGRRVTDLMMPPMLKLAGSASAQRRQAWIHEFDPAA